MGGAHGLPIGIPSFFVGRSHLQKRRHYYAGTDLTAHADVVMAEQLKLNTNVSSWPIM